MKEIKDTVAEKLGASGDQVKKIIVEKMVNSEVDKRVGLVESAIEKADQLEVELAKVSKPKKGYSQNGEGDFTEVAQNFTEQEVQTIRKTKEKIKFLNTAIAKVLSKEVTDQDVKALEKASK